MKAVITGADGFIGKNLVQTLLEKDFVVYAIGLNEKKLGVKDKNLTFYSLGFEDYNKLLDILPNDIDFFFHLAWSGVFGESFKNFENQIDNIKYSCKALNIAVSKNIKKFIFASTINVSETIGMFGKYGIKPRYTNIYGSCKLNAELILQTLAFQKGIEFNTGLISMVYGEENYSKMLPNIILKNFLQNKEVDLIPYDSLYDMIYVKDVADAFYNIATFGINQKHYYIGHKTQRKIGEIIDEIKIILSSRSQINYGKYKDETKLDFELLQTDQLFQDTGYELNSNFKETILSTANFIKNNLDYFNK